jgi:DNA-binding SARP family transcriptional activator
LADLKIYLLGTIRIERDGQSVAFDTRKADALLAYLAVTASPARRDSLAALLWPDYDTSSARAALRRTLSVLRKGIGEHFLEASYETIGLVHREDIWVDAIIFRGLIQDTKTHAHSSDARCAECLAGLVQAVELHRGDFLSGFSLRDSVAFDDWQFFQADEFRQELAWVLERLTEIYSAQGEFDPAIASARRWLSLDPLREEAHRQLMRLFAWSGQRNAALRQYRECVRILEQEIGVPPLDETSQLYQQILENLLPPPITLEESSPVGFLEDRAWIGDSHAADPALAGSWPGFTFPLIGRTDEWQTLVLCHSAARHNGWLVLLEGEAGIGKTRLAEEFITHASTLGAQVFQARCYEGETNLAYGPITEGLGALLKEKAVGDKLKKLPVRWLVEAARLQPEIATLFPDLPASEPMDSPGAQSHFFEGLRQLLINLLAGPVPGVLFLDDFQWADAASLELLTYIARRLAGSELLALLTWRGGLTESRPLILKMLAEAQRSKRGTLIQLARLSAAEIDELIRALPGNPPVFDDQFSQRLYQESEGLPLYAISYLNSAVQNPSLGPGGPLELPGDVRTVWQAQLSALDEISHQLLSTAALIGRSFDYVILKEASGRSDLETVTGLETLLANSLVVECNQLITACESTYDFAHEKLRELILKDISLARRQLLHRRIAEALLNAARGRREQGKVSAQVAYHFQQAGQNSQAAEYFKQAGELARALYANRAALAHFQAALAAGYPDAAGLHETCGDLYTLLGEYASAIHNYETAAAFCLTPQIARLEHKLGKVLARKGEWVLAESYFQVGLEHSEREEDLSLQALILSDWSLTAHRRGDAAQALDLASQSLNLAQQTDDPRALTQAYNMLGMLARARGDFEEAWNQLNNSLQSARDLGEPGRQVAALNNLALVSRDQRRPDQAIELTQAALSLCSQQGDRHREAALLNNLADLLHAAGRELEAKEYLRKSVVIFAEIGVEAGEQDPEIWRLSEW